MEHSQPLGFSYICLHAQLRPAEIVYCHPNPGPAKRHSFELLHWCGACCKITAGTSIWLDLTAKDGIRSDSPSEGIRFAVVLVHLLENYCQNFKIHVLLR